MKALVVYYSRTGTTRRVADAIAAQLKCDVEQIVSLDKREGPLGYMRCGREGMNKIPGRIGKIEKDPSAYDLVVVGTPIWSWNVSSITRAYLRQNMGKLKKAAFFCTMGGSGDDKAFASMEEECGSKPLATLALTTKEVLSGNPEEKIKEFVGRLKWKKTQKRG